MKKNILIAIAALALQATTGVAAERYVDHSVLASGRWVKIRIPETGIYMLTDDFIRNAGFSDPSKVKVYGYGGALQQERLTAAYITSTDDLMEVPTCKVGASRLFSGQGPVSWSTAKDSLRTRNPYSNYGYYFLTDKGGSPIIQDSATFVSNNYPSPNDYHSIYEVDNYSWYHGGRNLYEKRLLSSSESIDYTLPAYSESGKLTVAMTYEGYCNADVYVNDTKVGQVLVSTTTASKTNKKLKSLPDDYSDATVDTWTFNIKTGLKDKNTITLKQTDGGAMRLDYLVLTSSEPKPLPVFSQVKFSTPEIVEQIPNQDLHAHPFADMVIIIPANRVMHDQAERMKTLHESHDGMRVNIVAADEIFNEFSSGTPDATAYRRYMKMLYDRAGSNTDDRPRFLLLMGDGAWDNRMCSEKWISTTPDDFLLCYESENSFSETKCYVSDDYFCLLDDNEGADMVTDKIDAAVGRFPVRTPEDAKIMVDKAYSYLLNENAGPWQNTVCIMGDDGDKNRHMGDADYVAEMVQKEYPYYNVKKVYWDAYPVQKTASGNRYPEVSRVIKDQMQIGALVMNYSGHGGARNLSHEQVLKINDFEKETSLRLPLWITASCDIMPFDGQETNIGESAMVNPNGGAIAFFGTTRTVYAAWNRPLNYAFMKHVLGTANGKRITIGEAAMMAKNEFSVGTSRDMIVNKQQYTLLGDPAIPLAAPTLNAVIDRIDARNVSVDYRPYLKVGNQVVVEGHITDQPDFNGVVNYAIKDAQSYITCRRNDTSVTDTAMVYRDRQNTVFAGSASIKNGNFIFAFTVPKDISYADSTGQILLFAYNEDRSKLANGDCQHFFMSGDEVIPNDGVGPRIYCYIESPSFTTGSTVGDNALLYAVLSDNQGINTSDAAIGHNIELVIDEKAANTYNLNNYFTYSFGDFTSGTVNYNLPELSVGAHHLRFKAWDVLNNSSQIEFDFVIADKGIAGLEDIENDIQSSRLFDLQGRPVGHDNNTQRSRLYIKRDNQGKVKKILINR